jgi:hypothetical protein
MDQLRLLDLVLARGLQVRRVLLHLRLHLEVLVVCYFGSFIQFFFYCFEFLLDFGLALRQYFYLLFALPRERLHPHHRVLDTLLEIGLVHLLLAELSIQQLVLMLDHLVVQYQLLC